MTKLVTPTGRSVFSVLNEAVGWKGAETNRKFIQMVAFSRREGAELLQQLNDLSDKLFATEVERAKAKGQSGRFGRTPINYKDEGGEIVIKFQRREEDGPPVVVDSSNNKVQGRIEKNTGVQVAYEVRPYVMNNTFGISLKLLAIKTAKLEMTANDVADLFGEAEDKPVKAAPKKAASFPEEDPMDLF